ncbi:MAG: hypothetical protein ACYTF0_04045 [Planctomycetota bacterium]|jgi:hypothetical protein
MNQIAAARYQRLRQRNRRYLSAGFAITALTVIMAMVGTGNGRWFVIGALALAYLILTATHLSQLRQARRHLP